MFRKRAEFLDDIDFSFLPFCSFLSSLQIAVARVDAGSFGARLVPTPALDRVLADVLPRFVKVSEFAFIASAAYAVPAILPENRFLPTAQIAFLAFRLAVAREFAVRASAIRF